MLKKIYIFLWQNQTLSQTILKNTFWLGVSQIVGRLIRAVIVIYAARVLGADGYGVFSYAIAVIGFMSILADIGIDSILTREAVQKPNLRRQYLANSLIIKLVLLLALFGIISWIIPVVGGMSKVVPVLRIIAWAFLLDGLRNSGFAFIRSLERMEIEAAITFVTNTVVVLASLLLLRQNPTPTNLAIGYVIGSGVGTALTAIALGLHLREWRQSFAPSLIKTILAYSWPFAVLSFSNALLVYTDTLMLGWMTSAREVGLYTAAQRPIQLAMAVPSIIAIGTFPAISRFTIGYPKQLKLLLEHTLTIVMLMALPMATGIIILNRQIIDVLYGADYLMASNVLILFALSLLITFPAAIIGYAILAYDLQKRLIIPTTTGALLNVLLNVFLITKIGIVGAAIATLISQLVIQSWAYYYLQKQIKTRIVPQLGKILLATIAMGSALWWMNTNQWNLYWMITSSTLIYLILLIILREPVTQKIWSVIARAKT